MRTVTYILTGRPRNRTDCIDYARKHGLRKISIELMTHEQVSEVFVTKTLFAAYVWVFEDSVVTYEETYGRCFQHEPYEQQCVSIDNANRRLGRAIENLHERTGRSIEGEDQRFSYEVAYRKE